MSGSLTFPVNTSFVLTWNLVDSQGNPINNASVTATLYAGRSPRDPNTYPGTSVPPIVNLTLAYVSASAGQYAATVPGTLDPNPDGVGYVIVVDGLVSGAPVYHAEQQVVLDTVGASIDLTTVDLVKNKAEVQGSKDDAEIQSAITGFSQQLLNYTGQPSLNSVVTVDEFYDGNGNNRMFLAGYPIRLLRFVKIGPLAIPISTGITSWGVVIDRSKKSISIRNPQFGASGGTTTYPYPNYSRYGGFSRGPVFNLGVQNVEVNYDCGFYDTPPDLEYAVRCVVAINYKRKGWQDQASRVVSAKETTATTRYRDWAWPPEHDAVFENYKRLAILA